MTSQTLDDIYPPTPDGVPADLTAPTSAYTRHARLALLGLLAFVGLYLGLTWFFGNATWRLINSGLTAGDKGFIAFLLALAPGFLFLFMVRGFFFTKHSGESTDIEVTAEDEPLLVAFVHRIADEAGAPRPHRIFLSANVNAAVFYDLSFRNLLLPTKKNLVLGMGLVNALSVDEMKAVIAHEFGHFAQKTMAVGRYVYVSSQVAGHVVSSRGRLDSLLAGISVIDIRIAWIGWVMRLLVWSIRSILDTAFRGLVVAHRALSREMEFQADLVAVSLSGSDSLVHGLSRLSAADDAFDRAATLAMNRLGENKRITDLFAAQTAMLETMRRVMDDPDMGNPPPVPDEGADTHRVFEDEIAAPPQMWSTHPPNRDREENAKRRYVRSAVDSRSGWTLFADADALRATMTRRLLDRVTAEAPAEALEKLEDESVEGTLAALAKAFDKRPLDQKYRGSYLGRSVVLPVAAGDALFDAATEDSGTALGLQALYPESLSEEFERNRELQGEVAVLSALKEGVLEAAGGVIRFRGEEIPRSELAEVIQSATSEAEECEGKVLAHDRRVRTEHRAAAKALGRGWEEHHVGLCRLLHYLEHSRAEIEDAMGHLYNVFHVVMADDRVTSKERKRLLFAAEEVQTAITSVWEERGQVRLPSSIAEELEVKLWAGALPETFHLVPPSEEMLGDWLQAVESWRDAFINPLRNAGDAVLEELLATEEHVRDCVCEARECGDAPEPSMVPAHYKTCTPDQKRELQKKLGLWDRFVRAEGWFPGTLRTVVALSVLAPAMFLTGSAGTTSISVFNGLGTGVVVQVGEERLQLHPGAVRETSVPAADAIAIVTQTPDGRTIESFAADASSSWGKYVYNVAAAGALVEWTASYGAAADREPRLLGTPRFLATKADHLFEEPPTQIETKGSGGTRDVLDAIQTHPFTQLSAVDSPEQKTAMLRAHVRWDSLESPDAMTWLYLADGEVEDLPALIQARIEQEGNAVVLLRAEQDLGEVEAACRRHAALASASPDDGNLQYAHIRCAPEGPAQNEAFRTAHSNFPDNPWLTWGAAYGLAEEARWAEAAPMMELLADHLPSMGEQIGLTLAQARRASDPVRSPLVGDLADISARVAQATEIATADADPLDGLHHLRLLETGDYDLAWSAVEEADPETQARLAWLIATSHGASEAEIERAFALPPRLGIDSTNCWAAAALATQRGRDASPLLAYARENADEDDGEKLLALLEEGALDGEGDPIADALEVIDPTLRGQAYVMGIVLRGGDAPAMWRRWGKALLLPGMRPRIGG